MNNIATLLANQMHQEKKSKISFMYLWMFSGVTERDQCHKMG